MRILTLTAILGGLLGLPACEEPFELEGRQDNQLLIIGSLAAGSAPTVTLQSLDAFGDQVTEPGLAASRLTLANSSRSFELIRQSYDATSATFTAPGERIITGETYELSVSVAGYNDARGQTTVPSKVPSFALSAEQRDNLKFAPEDAYLEVPLDFESDPESANYYHLMVSVGEGLGTELAERVAFAEDIELDATTLPIASNEAENGSRVFSDELFVRDRLAGTLRIPTDELLDYFEPVLRIEIRSVSESYYLHPLSSGFNENNRVKGTNSSRHRDNITGGVGVLLSYNDFVEYLRLSR